MNYDCYYLVKRFEPSLFGNCTSQLRCTIFFFMIIKIIIIVMKMTMMTIIIKIISSKNY